MISSSVALGRRLVCIYTRFSWARLTRIRKRQQILLAVAFIILLVYFGYINVTKKTLINVLPVERRTVQRYCNFPVDSNGAEGSIPGNNGDLQLEIVQALVRHGDRSPFRKIQGMERRDFDCSMTPQNESAKKLFDGYLHSMDSFIVNKMSPEVVADNLLRRSEVCEYSGQLTQKGFQQLFDTGRHFKRTYSKLIEDGINNNQVYARSTNSDRTLQSVAALLYGFLGAKSVKQGHVAIGVFQDKYFRDNAKGMMSPCPAYDRIQKRIKNTEEYQAGVAAMEPLMLHMSNLLMTPRESMETVVSLADACLVHICHGLRPPCAEAGCISESTAFKLISYADWAFSHNYSQVADMISLPVMSQIASRMNDRVSSKTPIKFAVYGGHEISIIPALVSLGIFEQRWIPYASRLVFELWRKNGITNDTKKKQREYIRVLFNGKAVTSNLVFCRGFIEYEELCPLEDFLGWLRGRTNEEPQIRYGKMCEQQH